MFLALPRRVLTAGGPAGDGAGVSGWTKCGAETTGRRGTGAAAASWEWLDEIDYWEGEGVLGAGGRVEGANLEERLSVWMTTGAVSLQTGKLPRQILQLAVVAMTDDSTNCRFLIILEI